MRRIASIVLLALAGPTAAGAAASPEHIGAWTLTADPALSDGGCHLEAGDARDRLRVTLVGSDLRIEARSKVWFASGSLSYPAEMRVDAGATVSLSARGLDPDGLALVPNPKLDATDAVARLAAGSRLSLRKVDNPGIDTVTIPIADFASAYARLRSCAGEVAAKIEAGTAARHDRCEKLADAAASAIGGRRGESVDVDRVAIEAGDIRATVDCGTEFEPPSVWLTREARGFPDAMKTAAARLAGVLAGRPASAFAALPAACLGRVKGYHLRHGGKRVAPFPDGTTTNFEGTAKVPPITLSCSYYDPGQVEPSFTIERR